MWNFFLNNVKHYKIPIVVSVDLYVIFKLLIYKSLPQYLNFSDEILD